MVNNQRFVLSFLWKKNYFLCLLNFTVNTIREKKNKEQVIVLHCRSKMLSVMFKVSIDGVCANILCGEYSRLYIPLPRFDLGPKW